MTGEWTLASGPATFRSAGPDFSPAGFFYYICVGYSSFCNRRRLLFLQDCGRVKGQALRLWGTRIDLGCEELRCGGDSSRYEVDWQRC